MRAIIAGYGQLGKAVKEVFSDYHDIDHYDLQDGTPPSGQLAVAAPYDVLLVCFPYSEGFVDQVKRYKERFGTKAVIIFSTVPIGTTRQIKGAVHSPIEGKHPDLAKSIELAKRWFGGSNNVAYDFLIRATDLYVLPEPEMTEFLKLRSTARYGVNIEFARYEKAVCDAIGMNYAMVRKFDEDYNQLYLALGLPQYQRYILDPPQGNLGGHCLVDNAKLLEAQFPSVFLKEIYREKEGDTA